MTEPGAAIRLLYIDDDRGLSRLVQKELGRHGYEVICAPDADSGYEVLKAGQFDVCALDHYMPGREGLNVLPDILANAGGVVVSYFEWLQNISGDYWPAAKVQARLEEVIKRAARKVSNAALEHECDLREAAYVVALQRLAAAVMSRSLEH